MVTKKGRPEKSVEARWCSSYQVARIGRSVVGGWVGLFIAVSFPLDKKRFSALSFFTQVYKWVIVTYCWGCLFDGLAPHQGGSCNTSSCSRYRNRVYLQQCGQLSLAVRFYIFIWWHQITRCLLHWHYAWCWGWFIYSNCMLRRLINLSLLME